MAKRKSSTNETPQRNRKGKNKASSCTYKVRYAKSGKFVRKDGDHLGGAGKKKE